MAILLLMLAGNVLAQPVELFWDINGTDPGASGSTTAAGTWNDTNTYWNTDFTGGDSGTIGAWQSNAIAVFSAGGNATGAFVVSVSGTHQIGGLRFEEGAVTLSSGGALQFSGGATFTHNGAAGDCPVNSAVQGNGVLTLDGSGNWGRLNGVVSENGGPLSINLQSGNWVFGGQHTYTGDMTITGYAVPTVSSTGSASSGNLTSGPFGTGTLILTSGLLRPTSGGPITIGNAVTLGGNFSFGTSDTSNDLTFTGPLTLTGTRTLTTNSSNIYFNGVLGDGGNGYGFTKSGTSALVLGGDNTFTGAATINNGTLKLAHAGALNSAAPVAVNFSSNSNTKALQLAGHSVTVSGLSTGSTVGTSIVENNAAGTATLTVNNAAANTFAGVLRDGAAGTLALTKTGAGTLTLSGSSPNTYTGLTTVSDGRLHLGKSSDNAVGGDLTISGGAKVTFGGNNQIADNAAVTMSGVGSVFNGTGTNAGQLGTIQETIGSLNVTGGTFNAGNAATWTITGAGSFTGGAGNTIFVGNSGVGTTLSFGSLSLTAMTATAGGNVAASNSFTLYGNSLSSINTIDVGSGGLALDGSRFNLRRGNTTGALGSRLVLDGDVATAGTSASSILEDTSGGTIGSVAVELSSTSGDVTRTFNIGGGGANLTISVPITNGAASSAGIVKTGSGTLTLSGPAANTYTGLTTVNGGTLILNKTAGFNAVEGNIVVNSGTLDLGADNQIADTSDITVNGSANFNNNARLETVRNVTLNSSYSNPGNHRISNMTITGTLAVTNGVVGLNSNTNTTANVVNMSGSGRIEMAADTAPTIFNIGPGGLTMSGATLRFGWGGIGSAETAQVNLGGDFTGSGTNSLDYLTLNAPRLLDLQGATRTFNVTSGTTTISPTIQNGGLTKTGGGTLTFSGSNENTYTGLTTVSAGTLALGKTAGINAIAGNINVTGGTLTLNAANQIADTSDITVNGAGRFSTGGPNYAETVRNLTMDSSVTDPNINRVSNLTVTDTLTVKRGAVGVNSGFSATAGTLDMSGGSIIGLAGNTANTTVHIGNGGLIMSDATLRFGWIWSGVLDSPYTIRVNLAGDFTGSGTNSLDYVTTLGPRLLDLQGATRTFNITGGTTTISPTIQNGGLTKTGAGALVLSGANTYTGPTTVDAGLLLVNGTHTGGGAYSVHGSGTLGGTGSIGSVVGVGAGGKLAPGASIGTLAIGDHLTLAGGSTFEWEFNSDNLTADLLNVDGDLALLGNVSLDLVDLAAPAGAVPVDTKFTLISYSGDWNGGVFEDYANYSTFTSGLNEWRIRYNDVAPDLNGAFGSFVTLRVIPEPSSIVLLLAAVFGLLLRRRARFSRNRAPAYP